MTTTTPPDLPALSDEERELLSDFSTKARAAEALAVQAARLAVARGVGTPSLDGLLTEFAVRDEDAAQARRKWLGLREARLMQSRRARAAHLASEGQEGAA